MTSLIHPVKIFSGTASSALTASICEYYGSAPGDMTVARFSDGEFQPNFNESVRGCDVFIVQSTYPSTDNLFELLMAIDAAKRASANYITAVIPYYGFARQDRKDKPRVSIASKLVADLLSTAGANRVMTMELHAPQIQGFFQCAGGPFGSVYHFRSIHKKPTSGQFGIGGARRRIEQPYSGSGEDFESSYGDLR